MKKVWETKEFREAKKGKIGNKCEQCGSTENLTPHHPVSFNQLYLLKLRELTITQMGKEQNFSFTSSAINKEGGFSTSKGYIKSIILRGYISKNIELKNKAKELAEKDYLEFKDIETLCKKCHFATESGMILCEYCKKRYYNPINFISCFDCKEKAQTEQEKFEMEIDEREKRMIKESEAIEKFKKSIKEEKILTVDEMKEEAVRVAKSIPNFEEKRDQIVQIRGYVIEFALSIERSLNELITKSGGEELVINPEKKTLQFITGLRDKRDLPKFKTKTRDIKNLIEKIFIEHKRTPELNNLQDAFNRFEAIRDIFAHVPLDWDSNELEFDDKKPYKHLFKDSKWKKVFFALGEFMQIYKYLTDVVLIYNRQVQLKEKIYQSVLLGIDFRDAKEQKP